jgi:hypothetical protein
MNLQSMTGTDPDGELHVKRDARPIPGRQRSFGRGLAFRLLAIMLGLGVVLLIEGLLRLTNLGRLQDVGDPYVGFSQVVPLFVLNEAGDKYEISRSRYDFFQPDSFAANKGESEFRIFCLGGSTVQGNPYSIETSFTTWLELSLKAADPSREWQVVNCGGISYASYRLIPIMQELLVHEPDMFIVYTGQNEFLEERTYGDIKRQAAWVKQLHEQLMGWRIYGLTSGLLKSQSKTTKTENLTAEVEALLDFQGGLEKYHRDDSWRDGVIEHYEHSLRRMVHIAREARVPIVLANPVSNLRDSPPFKAEVDRQLTAAAQAEFVQLWEEAKQSDWEDLPAKTALVKRALAIDERHAESHFLLAKIYEAAGDMEAAKIEYVRAKDEDICPLRILEAMHQSLRRVADQTGTPLIDIRQLFEDRAKDGIPGDPELIDHVHPRIEGHQLIAMEFFRYMERQRMVSPSGDWIVRQTQLYQANWDSLPANYYLQGLARLEGLQRWAQGRVKRLRINTQEKVSN